MINYSFCGDSSGNRDVLRWRVLNQRTCPSDPKTWPFSRKREQYRTLPISVISHVSQNMRAFCTKSHKKARFSTKSSHIWVFLIIFAAIPNRKNVYNVINSIFQVSNFKKTKNGIRREVGATGVFEERFSLASFRLHRDVWKKKASLAPFAHETAPPILTWGRCI